jgi:small-conductance mechanosensitive channel
MTREEIVTQAERRNRVAKAVSFSIAVLVLLFWWLLATTDSKLASSPWQLSAIGVCVVAAATAGLIGEFVKPSRPRQGGGDKFTARPSVPRLIVSIIIAAAFVGACCLMIWLVGGGYHLEGRWVGREWVLFGIMLFSATIFAGLGFSKLRILLAKREIIVIDAAGYLDTRVMRGPIKWSQVRTLSFSRSLGGRTFWMHVTEAAGKARLFGGVGDAYAVSDIDLDCCEADLLLAISDHAPGLVEALDPKAR